jgi:hypothetical protein
MGRLRSWPEDDDDFALSEDDELGGDSDPRLSLEQYAALDAVPGLAAALHRSPYCGELVKGAVLVGEAALKATPSDEQARALHRIRRLAFGHRLFERLLERACLRAIDKRAIRRVSSWPRGVRLPRRLRPGRGAPRGAKVVRGAVHASFPFIAEIADRAARALTRAADLAPAPTPEVGERLQPLSGLAQPIAFHWMALGDDDLGLLDVVLDHLAAVDSADSPMAEVSAETTQGVAPRILSRLPAAVRLFGADPSQAAAFLGQVATELLLRLAVARAAKARVGDGPDASTDRA